MLRKAELYKSYSLNFGGVACLLAAVSCICYLLCEGSALPFSLNFVLVSLKESIHSHVWAVGLLPVYLALMVFGTAMLGIFLGSAVQRWITYRFHK